MRSFSALVATVVLTASLVGASAGTASAIPLEIQGTTSGSFSIGPIDLGSSLGPLGLAFTGTSFGPTTSTNIVLGSFTLNSFLAVFSPFDFTLDVDFIVPPGAGGTSLFADLAGAVLPVIGGFVKIDFVDNSPIHFTYNGGSFDLSVGDVTLTNGTSRNIVGTISNYVGVEPPVAVSGPGTVLLMLTGAGLVSTALARRRR